MRTGGLASARGVTLIELMVVVAVVAILAMIAYPSYQEQMRKSRRADAAGALTSLANAMERFHVAHGSYIGAGTEGGDDATGPPAIFPTQAPLDGERKFYDLRIVSASVTDYVLAAIPLAGGPQAGDGELRLDSTGARTRGGQPGW